MNLARYLFLYSLRAFKKQTRTPGKGSLERKVWCLMQRRVEALIPNVSKGNLLFPWSAQRSLWDPGTGDASCSIDFEIAMWFLTF